MQKKSNRPKKYKKNVQKGTKIVKKERTDWIMVGENIQKAIYDLITQKKPPTITNISTETGYHRHTIERHADTLNFKTTSKNYSVMSERILIHLLSLTTKHPAACKLWFQVVEGWKEPQENIQPNEAIIIHLEGDNHFKRLPDE